MNEVPPGIVAAGLSPATPLRRLGAAALDVVILCGLFVALQGLGLALPLGSEGLFRLKPAFTVIAIAYTVVFWWRKGTTPGKALLGMRIVTQQGKPLTLGRALLRYVGYILASWPLKLGFAPILWDPLRRGWHDQIAGTLVVRTAAKQPASPGGPEPAVVREEAASSPRGAWAWRFGALGFYTALAVAFTWPLSAHISSHVPYGPDTSVFMWDMWWAKKVLTTPGLHYFSTDYMYWPNTVSLRYHTLCPLASFASVPLQGLLGLTLTYNLFLLGAFVLSAFSMHLLTEYLTRCAPAALLAGVAFGFSSYMGQHGLEHLNLVSVEWMPLFLLAMVLAADTGKTRWAILAALFYLLNALTDWYNALFLTIFAVIFVPVYALSRPNRKDVLRAASAGAVLSAAAVLPLVLPMIAERGLHRRAYMDFGLDRLQTFSADLLNYIVPTPLHPVWGRFFTEMARSHIYWHTEHNLYLGAVCIALAIVGLRARPAGLHSWAAAGLCALALSFGPHLQVNRKPLPVALPLLAGGLPGSALSGAVNSDAAAEAALDLLSDPGALVRTTAYPQGPYRDLLAVPPFRPASVPVRFGLTFTLAVSVAAAFGFAHLWRRWGNTRRRRVLLLGLPALLAFELLPAPYPIRSTRMSPLYQMMASDPEDCAVVDVPLDWAARFNTLSQTAHGKKVFCSVHSRYPPNHNAFIVQNVLLCDITVVVDWQRAIAHLSQQFVRAAGGLDAVRLAQYRGALDQIREVRGKYIVVHRSLPIPGNEVQAAEALFGRQLGLRLVGEDDQVAVFRTY